MAQPASIRARRTHGQPSQTNLLHTVEKKNKTNIKTTPISAKTVVIKSTVLTQYRPQTKCSKLMIATDSKLVNDSDHGTSE